jgi:hypothetical protein
MIDAFDVVLRRLLTTTVATITSDEQVRFRPPNDGWRNDVVGLQKNALNVYLVELRENQILRSSDRLRETRNGLSTTRMAPRRIDCHYLITAWSPTDVTPALEPTLDEHRLLYDTAAALMLAEPLVPERVFEPDALPDTFPSEIAQAEIPIRVLPADGFPKYAELWGTMGDDLPWKPAVYLIATLPVVAVGTPSGPPVTSLVSEYRVRDSGEPDDVLLQIGGVVRGQDGTPIPDAWVRLETADDAPTALQTTRTDDLGRFAFAGLRAGTYRLRARAAGRGEAPALVVEAPSESGTYDLEYPRVE